jgi:putative addiction module CopG family antidote
MSKTYSPGADTDEIIERQVAKGNFATADEVVRASVQMLAEQEAELAYLRSLVDEGDGDLLEGRVHRYASADALAADIVSRGEARLQGKR